MREQQGKARRAPNYVGFMLTGVLLGLVVGVALSVFGNPDPRYDATAGMGFLALIGTGLGVLLGGLVAALFDRRS